MEGRAVLKTVGHLVVWGSGPLLSAKKQKMMKGLIMEIRALASRLWLESQVKRLKKEKEARTKGANRGTCDSSSKKPEDC